MSNRKAFFALVFIISCAGGIIGVSRARRGIDINKALDKNNVVHVAIIGSGPAGLSAAVYGARFKRNVLVFKGPKPGGLLTETSEVENWPGNKTILGPVLIADMEQHARSLGVTCVQDTVESVDFNQFPFVLHTQQGDTIYALSVIIATGGAPLFLGVKGEQEYWGKGVTSCAKCDAPFYKGEDVVVVGGGDSAVEEAIQLAPYARKITVLVRKDRMKAAQSMQDRLRQYPSITVLYNVEIKEITGDTNQVTGVSLWDNKDKVLKQMPLNGVFLAIGHKPNTDVFKSSLKMDANGYIKLVDGRTQKTSIPGVFAAGDAEDNYYRQAIVASGSGVRAAIDADAFLTEIGLSLSVQEQLRPHLFSAASLETTVKEVATVAAFDELVASGALVVVDFFTPDCPSCNELEPIFNLVARDYAHVAEFIKVDAQELIDLSERLHITKVPCVMIFKEGNLVASYRKVLSKEELKEAVDIFVG
ncbi:MAG: FAD-dependent oxidoreductase [Candidatus Dependentiae bacterium]|nr:FAD-dependent oxidoreductase [Candidatus Dependentiae bacterium]